MIQAISLSSEFGANGARPFSSDGPGQAPRLPRILKKATISCSEGQQEKFSFPKISCCGVSLDCQEDETRVAKDHERGIDLRY